VGLAITLVQVFGVVSEHPQVFLLVCLDVVLTNNVVGTSFKLD